MVVRCGARVAGSHAVHARDLSGRLQHLTGHAVSRCSHHALHQVSSLITHNHLFSFHCREMYKMYIEYRTKDKGQLTDTASLTRVKLARPDSSDRIRIESQRIFIFLASYAAELTLGVIRCILRASLGQALVTLASTRTRSS